MAPSRPPRPPAQGRARDPRECLRKRGADLLRKVADKDVYAIFVQPVEADHVPGYAELIKRPMDLATMRFNLERGVYRTPREFRADLDLIWINCCKFNADDSIYYAEAVRLRALAARYYEDLVRGLSRDGVAVALGLAAPPAPRPAVAAVIPEPLAVEPPPPPPNPARTLRQDKLRRAKAALAAAEAAATSALAAEKAAASGAGLPLPLNSPRKDIFAGPGESLLPGSKADTGRVGVAAPGFPNANTNPLLALRWQEVPRSWRRIGRWHPRAALQSKLLTPQRALDVHYGRRYEHFVRNSAPIARRLLASVLDPAVVLAHDRVRLDSVPAQDVDTGPSPAKRPRYSAKEELNSESAPRATSRHSTANGILPQAEAIAPQALFEVPGRDAVAQILDEAKTGIPPPPSPHAVQELKQLLQEHSTDTSFLEALTGNRAPVCHPNAARQSMSKPLDLRTVRHNEKQYARTNGGVTEDVDALHQLLADNHAILVNVIRLRALKECAVGHARDELETREIEYANVLARGVQLAASQLPPRMLVHPVDVASTAVLLAKAVRGPRVKPEASTSDSVLDAGAKGDSEALVTEKQQGGIVSTGETVADAVATEGPRGTTAVGKTGKSEQTVLAVNGVTSPSKVGL